MFCKWDHITLGSSIMQCATTKKQKTLQISKVECAKHRYRSNLQALHPHLQTSL